MGEPRATRVWICQCLCPARHAIIAASGEAEDAATAEVAIAAPLRAQVASLLAAGLINPWCGLCQAPVSSWFYELGRTRFATMAEAEAPMREQERRQAVTRGAFGDLKRSD